MPIVAPMNMYPSSMGMSISSSSKSLLVHVMST
jgi:hypothetical protein